MEVLQRIRTTRKLVLSIIKETAEVLRAYNKERTLREFNTLTASEAKQISDSSALYVCIKRLRSKDTKAKICPKRAK